MVGKTISHYKILGMLGAGGMGEVYLAEDTELGRKVALKFLPPQSTTEADIKARFKHEAKAAAALNHPNIVTVYEVGEHEGQSYISMEYVEGESLKDLLAKQELSTNRVIEIASQICEGLSKAHQAGIVQRDIKPENILINSEGRVKIADFGLAKLGNVTKLTKESSTLGTLSYMSPEQIQGADVDQRSDIFSLGVVLYEIITRQLPFKGDYEATVSYSIVHEEPEPLARYKSGISEGLQHIVDKALDKNLDTRYQHVDDLLADLKRERLGSALTQAARASRTRKPIRAFMFAGTLILTTILLVTGYFFFSGEAESTERILIAVVDFLNETDEPELDGLSGMLITSLEQSRRLSVITRSRMLDMLKQLGRQDVERIDESLGREICQQANVGALLTATVSKLGKLYAIDLKVFDIKKNKHLVKAREQDEGQENVLNMLDKLAEKARKGLKEKEEEIQGARSRPRRRSESGIAALPT
ncbi:MAG: protein kinase, partial [Candidatus Zixiibacteriota bacterium]